MPPAGSPPDGGFALLWRKFLEHPYWVEKRVFSRAEAWIDCWFAMAAFRDHRRMIAGQLVTITRGQFVASDRFLERRWRWSRSKVRRFIVAAIEAGELVRDGQVNAGCSQTDTALDTGGGTIYRVVNYDDYQLRDTALDTGGDTTNGPATDQQRAKEKQGKTRESKNTYTPEFEVAWQEYPVRAGGNSKADALRQWKARIAEGTTPAEMIAGTKRYAAFCFATGKLRTEYVKQARTFFGRDRHYLEAWTPPTDIPRRAEPGSEARAVTNELPQYHDSPRIGKMVRLDGETADPNAERADAWARQHPEEAAVIEQDVAQEFADDPKMAHMLAFPTVAQKAIRSMVRNRILEQLRPKVAAS